MGQQVHPFAGGGGGFRFEYAVGTSVAVEMLLGRLSSFGGVVDRLHLQRGPCGFDDLQIDLELVNRDRRRVHVQSRANQPFTASNTKFIQLLQQAAEAVSAAPTEFGRGERRLAIVVSTTSPGHEPMAALCDLARGSISPSELSEKVVAHGGAIARRWGHCLAASQMAEDELHAVLSALEVHTRSLRTQSAPDWVELLNRLAVAWEPPNFAAAGALASAILVHLTELGQVGGSVDATTLRRNLTVNTPPPAAAVTRVTRLERRKAGVYEGMQASLELLGLDQETAATLAERALGEPLRLRSDGVMVVFGGLGVGKTTELRRHHLRAIESAIVDPHAPLPVFLHASAVVAGQLRSAVEREAQELGDPSRRGVSLTIDGVDEVALPLGDLVSSLRSTLAMWPRSTALVASRPQYLPDSVPQVSLEPMSADESTALMALIDDRATARWHESDLEEVLRRPLFAIRYALDYRQGNYVATRRAHLVDHVGRSALSGVRDMPNGFELLTRLAVRLVDSGGVAVELRGIGASPIDEFRLARSRLLEVSDGRARFQLAVLSEWFAGTAILGDPALRREVLANPVRVHRWRYAIVQALAQAPAEHVDQVMVELLDAAPATASWAFDEACPDTTPARTSPPASSAHEAGQRIRTAAEGWLKPWPLLRERATLGGRMQPLGVALDGPRLATVWYTLDSGVTAPITELQAGQKIDDSAAPAYTRAQFGRPTASELWPWKWTQSLMLEWTDELLGGFDLAAEVDLCSAELAWTYAHLILGRQGDLPIEALRVAGIQAAIGRVAQASPGGDTVIISRGNRWKLSDAQAFTSDLTRLQITELTPPWSAPDQRGGWTWSWWSTERLLERVNQFTAVVLDVYQAIVERHFATMMAGLPTYQLLPANIVGHLRPERPDEGYAGQPGFSWYIDPLPPGSPNGAIWQIRDDAMIWDEQQAWYRGMRDSLRHLRGDRAELVDTVRNEDGLHAAYTAAPATTLALQLLSQDLESVGWLKRRARSLHRYRPARPRFA